MIQNTNDGSNKTPYLREDISMGNCDDLPEFSKGPKGSSNEKHAQIKQSGYKGVQCGDPFLCRKYGLHYTVHARLDRVGELDEKINQWKDNGSDCTTLHIGTGMESDDEIDRLLGYLINLSIKTSYPLYVETHRATITQDMYRTVKCVERFPGLRFNGDFSHWYTGQEMVYGNFSEKLDFIQPVLDRVRFMHGRIGNPGHIQVNIDDGNNKPYVEHFKEIWFRCMVGFLKSAKKGDFLSFNPELLPGGIYYAYGIFKKEKFIEESDRWEQAAVLTNIARQCWDKALTEVKPAPQ